MPAHVVTLLELPQYCDCPLRAREDMPLDVAVEDSYGDPCELHQLLVAVDLLGEAQELHGSYLYLKILESGLIAQNRTPNTHVSFRYGCILIFTWLIKNSSCSLPIPCCPDSGPSMASWQESRACPGPAGLSSPLWQSQHPSFPY